MSEARAGPQQISRKLVAATDSDSNLYGFECVPGL
jgi:hypothetical protein